jgi:WD40 repeat protein
MDEKKHNPPTRSPEAFHLRIAAAHRVDMFNSVAFSPDGRWLASGYRDKTVKLWDTASGNLIRSLEGHQSAVNSVAFSPDGRWLASGSADKTVKLWDPSSGKLVRSLESHRSSVLSVAFSPDGRWLASGSSDNTVKLWEVETGAEIETYREIPPTHSLLTAEFRLRARIAATFVETRGAEPVIAV